LPGFNSRCRSYFVPVAAIAFAVAAVPVAQERCATPLEPIREGLDPVSVARNIAHFGYRCIEAQVPDFPGTEFPIERVVQAQCELVHSLKARVPGFVGFDTAMATVSSGRFAGEQSRC
jgi:hypothetical protein